MQIAILDGYPVNPGDNPWDPVTRLGPTRIYDRTAPVEVVSRAADAQILVINKVRLGREHFAALPALRMVTVSATGFDILDVAAAREFGIVACNVPEYGTASVAQHTVALLLELCHRTAQHDLRVRDGTWANLGDFCYWDRPLFELSGQTAGIVGWGKIGRAVGRILAVLGMRLLVHSRRQQRHEGDPPLEWMELDPLCAQANVLTLHCPLTAATHHMIHRSRLQLLPPGALLVNTARGALISEPDLVGALEQGDLGGAALDTFAQEPLPADSPLLRAPRLLLTPHMAWGSLPARRRLMRIVAENIAAFLAGHPQNVVT